MAGRDLAEVAQNAVAARKQTEGQAQAAPSIQAQINAPWVKEQIQKQLGPSYDAGVFLRSVVNSIKAAPDLEQCDPASIFGGMFTAAQLRLELGAALGQAFLIPRRSKDSPTGWAASFQIGYKGSLALAYRTATLTGANTELVRQGDEFKRGSNSERGPFYDLEYGKDHDNPKAPIKGVIGMFWVVGTNRPTWRYLTIDQVEARRPDYTKPQAGNNGSWTPNTPWKTNYDQMVEKTGMIEGLKYAPKSAHLALAMAVDDMVLTATREAPQEITAKADGRDAETIELTGDQDE